jgi:hypothetical protein
MGLQSTAYVDFVRFATRGRRKGTHIRALIRTIIETKLICRIASRCSGRAVGEGWAVGRITRIGGARPRRSQRWTAAVNEVPASSTWYTAKWLIGVSVTVEGHRLCSFPLEEMVRK